MWDSSEDSGFSFSYFVIGFGFGVLCGLLFAPSAGEELRENVRRRTSDSLDYLNERADKLRGTTEGLVSKTREWMGRRKEDWQSSAEDARSSAEQKPTM
jgi:gas vesicle protein